MPSASSTEYAPSVGRRIAIPFALLFLAASSAAAGTWLLAPVLFPIDDPVPGEPGPGRPAAVEPTAPPGPSAQEAPRPAGPADTDAGAAHPAPSTRRGPGRAGRRESRDDPSTPLVIERDDRGIFVVSRAQIEQELQSGEGLRGARAHRQELPGGVAGFRLAGVSRGALGRLGLRDGDVLTAINGVSVDSADAALGAFQRLRSAGSLRVTVVRGGGPVTLHYRIE